MLSEQDDSSTEGPHAERELGAELAQERTKNSEILSRLKYAQADLENLRKRSEREAKEVAERRIGALVSRLLPVADELDLALQHGAGESSGTELAEGLMMVRRNLFAALEAEGLEKIECVGRRFDPKLHEAVEKVQGEGEEDTVVGELRPGYTFRGHLMRPSMVKVELAIRPAQEAKGDE
ncbi:MAG: nucleotide exchange factor GrpE [archaeon]|nr:MAG: nucleotide exchange factor GrpE [archaeon]